MMFFDVSCQVLEPIEVTDASGKNVTIAPGTYRLDGVDRLIRDAGGKSVSSGVDLKFIEVENGRHAYTISSENLAHFIALDEVEVKP